MFTARRFTLAAALLVVASLSAGAQTMESNSGGGAAAPKDTRTVDDILANPDAARRADFIHIAETPATPLVTDPNDRDTTATPSASTAGVTAEPTTSSASSKSEDPNAGVSEATGAAVSDGVTQGDGIALDGTKAKAPAPANDSQQESAGASSAVNVSKRVLVVITVYDDGTTDERHGGAL